MLMADCVRCTNSPARVKLPALAALTKVRNTSGASCIMVVVSSIVISCIKTIRLSNVLPWGRVVETITKETTWWKVRYK